MKSCTHKGRRLCAACLLQTAIFPVEHVIWGKFLGPLLGVAI